MSENTVNKALRVMGYARKRKYVDMVSERWRVAH